MQVSIVDSLDANAEFELCNNGRCATMEDIQQLLAKLRGNAPGEVLRSGSRRYMMNNVVFKAEQMKQLLPCRHWSYSSDICPLCIAVIAGTDTKQQPQ